MSPKNVKVKIQLDEGATMPRRAHDTDSGYDLRAKSVIIRKYNNITGEWTEVPEYRWTKTPGVTPWQAVIDTGVHLQPEPGWGFQTRPNSRNGKSLFRWSFSPGTIDGNYTGSIKVLLEPRFEWVCYEEVPKPGEVCCQIMLEEIHNAIFEQVTKLDETERGDGGFGSTKNKK